MKAFHPLLIVMRKFNGDAFVVLAGATIRWVTVWRTAIHVTLSKKFNHTMKIPNSFRLVVACLTLISLLFMQLALASYVCPAMPGVTNQLSSDAAMKTPCQQTDLDQPALCRIHASDSGSKLSLDKPDVPDVHAFVPVRIAQTIKALPVIAHAIDLPARSRATYLHPPPTLILHCCFQI